MKETKREGERRRDNEREGEGNKENLREGEIMRDSDGSIKKER